MLKPCGRARSLNSPFITATHKKDPAKKDGLKWGGARAKIQNPKFQFAAFAPCVVRDRTSLTIWSDTSQVQPPRRGTAITHLTHLVVCVAHLSPAETKQVSQTRSAEQNSS